MKVVALVTLALVAAVYSAPADKDVVAQILRSDFNQNPEGSYNYQYETDNGLVRQETGEVKEALDEENKPHQVVVVRGYFNYVDPEGKPVKIEYYADETGFHATGDSIPQQQ